MEPRKEAGRAGAGAGAPRHRAGVSRFFSDLGPGLITGAADDDPSGISTYSVAGATFGYLPLWTAIFSFPLMSGSLPVQHLMDVAVGSLARIAPSDVLVLVREQLVQIADGPPRGLLALSLVGALWSSSSAMTAIIDTLNQAYHVRESRSWWRVRLIAVGLTVVLVAVALVAAATVLIGPMLAERLASALGVPGRFARGLWAIAEWPFVFALMMTALGWVYYFAPDVRRRWEWITPGSIAATLLWILASLAFTWYAAHFGDYQKTYGAIGGVIVTLLWFYASGLAILIGAELNAVVEQATAEQQARAAHEPTRSDTSAACD